MLFSPHDTEKVNITYRSEMVSNLLLRLTSTYPYTRCIVVVTSCIISCTVIAVSFVIRVVEAVVVRRKTVQKVKKYLEEIFKKKISNF